MSAPFAMPVQVRYLEADQQGVAFNMWYLAWFDEAFAAYLAHRGLPYPELIAAGADVMLARTEVDWFGPARWPDRLSVAVATARVGRTSFTLDYQVRRESAVLADGRTVYVVIGVGDGAKRAIPDELRAALGEAAPLH